MDGSSASGGIAGCGSPAGENAPMQLYVGNTDILPGGTWTPEDGITWTRNDSAEDHCVRYENNILTLKNVTVLGEFNASGNTSGAGIYAVGQLNRSVSLNIELLGNNTVAGFSGIAAAANHSSGKNASLTIQGLGNLTVEGAGVVDGGIAIRASDGSASLTIENVLVKASGGRFGAGVLLEAANNSRAELAVNVAGGSLTANGSDSYGAISYYCGADRAAGHARMRVSGSALINAVNGIKTVGAVPLVPEAGDGGDIVFNGNEGTVYGCVILNSGHTIRNGETLRLGGAMLNTNGHPIVVESGGRLEGYVIGETLWKVSGVMLKQNSLRLKQNGTAEIQASLGSLAAKKMTWGSTPGGVIQITQDPVDGTKASVKPLKERSATVTVASEGEQEMALCDITIKAVKKEPENVAVSRKSGMSGAGIRAFFHSRKRNKK